MAVGKRLRSAYPPADCRKSWGSQASFWADQDGFRGNFPSTINPAWEGTSAGLFDWLVDEKIMAKVTLSLWPFVRGINCILMLKSERRFALVYYTERVISKVFRPQFRFKLIRSHLDGALFCFCVNNTASTYAGAVSRLKRDLQERLNNAIA
jgi:hypothetical protein